MASTKNTQFNCFSPPIMLATFTIEIVLAVYTVWRYKMTVLTRLITLSLLALALFQLSEYYDCTGLGVSAETWSRIGFASITTLPALGTHMLYQLADRPRRRLVVAAYGSMILFIGYFLLARNVFRGDECTGNYVIFQLTAHATWLYSLYYYGWLGAGIALGAHWANRFMKLGKKAATKLQTVRGLIVGYLIFLVPTTVATTIKPEARRGIPSIMCGFAILFAFILTWYILPRTGQRRIGLDTLSK